MKKDLSRWSLVIVGRWNTAILSPQWLAKEVFKQAEIKIMYPVLGVGHPIFEAGDIKIVVSNESVTFIPLKDTNELLSRIEEAARHVLTTLPYTPILAFGENFHYTMEGSPGPFDFILNLGDAEKLNTQGRIGEVSLVRTIHLKKCQLNLKLTHDGSYHVELNYHYPAPSESQNAQTMAELIKNTYTNNREHGLSLLRSVYNLTLEEDANHDNQQA